MFAVFGGITYWFPKMLGRMMNERVGKLHFLLTFIGFNGNRDLALNTMNWLSSDEDLISIRPKAPEDRRVTMTRAQMNVVRITVTVFLHSLVSAELAKVVFHDVAGWVMMPLALFVLWLELLFLDRLWLPVPAAESEVRSQKSEVRSQKSEVGEFIRPIRPIRPMKSPTPGSCPPQPLSLEVPDVAP